MTPEEVAAHQARPRVDGEREQEIFHATLTVLAEMGYDNMTLDAVATAAHASKATLYRRWNGKLALVIDALKSMKATSTVPDTGSLREDLLATYCSAGGVTDRASVDTFASVLTAVTRDPEFAEVFRAEIVEPKLLASRAIYERAQERGEIPADADIDLFAHSLAGIVLHRHYVLGAFPDDDLVARVLDQIILPALHHAPGTTTPRIHEAPRESTS
ncbi:MAG TPA: TetR/AcrR family transcriptional regulator [Ornithinibacter sp.]|nr:TetR/AcrR family transcriptional regulator [Ornithinibacter sp.]